MKRVLLLNPPANPPVSRDYYCGHFTKGRHYWPQLDLLVMSGILSREFDLQVLDAVVEGLSPEETHSRIAAIGPDAVVAMTAAVSWSADMAFLSRTKDELQIPILISGDYPRAEPQAVLADNPFVDAVVLDFTDNDACVFLAGERDGGLRNVYTRADSCVPTIVGTGTFSYPVPSHELFLLKRYRMPQSLHHPAVQILTDFGCPFDCDFCFMERVTHRLRDIDNVAEELETLHKRGIRELFVADQSFGSNEKHARSVCEVIRNAGGGRFSWSASMRVDAATPELLKVMREAGCHTLMFGVETASQDVLDEHRKRTTVGGIEAAFAMTREMGFRTLAHFVIGLTGEDEESLGRIVEFAKALDPDIASFNVAAPAWNTSFGDQIRDKDLMIDEGVEIAARDAAPVWEAPGLSVSTILRLRDDAIRRFYMRPGYILKQLTRVRSMYQLRVLFREGIGMLVDQVTSSPGRRTQ